MNKDLAPYIQHNLKLHRKIGMFVSGGFDSAVLLYLVNEVNNLTFEKEKNRSTLTAYTVPKYDGSYDHSPNVVKWVAVSKRLCYQVNKIKCTLRIP